MWWEFPTTAWLVRPGTILEPKAVKTRMKSQRRHPEQWEPQEFIGTTFSGHWYYFGTYSIASEPVSVTKEEFKQLSHEVCSS